MSIHVDLKKERIHMRSGGNVSSMQAASSILDRYCSLEEIIEKQRAMAEEAEKKEGKRKKR